MTANLALVLLVGVLFGTGVYLLLERSLSRVLIGILLMGNGANILLLVAGGKAGGPPIIGTGPEEEMADPLPQALVLTAIVITLGMTAFLLAMAYRSWQLHGHDEVQDDLEDARIARRAARRVVQRTEYADVAATLAKDAAEARDETAHALPAIKVSGSVTRTAGDGSLERERPPVVGTGDTTVAGALPEGARPDRAAAPASGRGGASAPPRRSIRRPPGGGTS